MKSRTTYLAGLRAVSAFEFLKGLFVVLVGFGLISLAHRGIDIEDIARSLLYVLHISPHHRHLSEVFLRVAARFEDTNLVKVAVGALVYSLMRFVESYGLWRGRVWAQWFALISGGVYIPLEIYEIFRKPAPIRFALLFVNVLIVAYMGYLRMGELRTASSEL